MTLTTYLEKNDKQNKTSNTKYHRLASKLEPHRFLCCKPLHQAAGQPLETVLVFPALGFGVICENSDILYKDCPCCFFSSALCLFLYFQNLPSCQYTGSFLTLSSLDIVIVGSLHPVSRDAALFFSLFVCFLPASSSNP